MPRPTRAYGRAGTPVIPKNWERDHAPVVDKTRTGLCRIYLPGVLGEEPVMDVDLSYDGAPTVDPVYEGSCRVQHLGGSREPSDFAGQSLTTARYLVVIGRDADTIPKGSVVLFNNTTDPDLDAVPALYVADKVVGTLRFERDLFCVADLSLVGEV